MIIISVIKIKANASCKIDSIVVTIRVLLVLTYNFYV